MTVYAGTYGWTLEVDLLLDGAAWDVSAGTVTLLFVKPSGATVLKDATPGNGLATYVIENGLLDEGGIWECLVTATLAPVRHARAFQFTVIEIP